MIKHIAEQGLHILFSLSHKATTEIPYSYIPYKPQPPAKLFSLFFFIESSKHFRRDASLTIIFKSGTESRTLLLAAPGDFSNLPLLYAV